MRVEQFLPERKEGGAERGEAGERDGPNNAYTYE
jgi:hypothetical protein